MNEENKVIAEYMGAVVTEPYPEHKEYGRSYHFEFNNSEKGKQYWPENERTYTNSSIKYHTSWDWIMPVYKKVMDEVMKDYDSESGYDQWERHMNGWLGVAQSSLLVGSLPALHETIVNIIKLLNEQK